MAEKSFIWHKVSNKEKEQIKRQAKSIMDNFARALDKVKLPKEIAVVERQQDIRQEREGEACTDKDFRKLIFKNAPKKQGNHFVAEKGGWI